MVCRLVDEGWMIGLTQLDVGCNFTYATKTIIVINVGYKCSIVAN